MKHNRIDSYAVSDELYDRIPKSKFAKISVLDGKLVIDGLKYIGCDVVTVDGDKMVTACLEAHLRIRNDGKEYPVIAPLEITNHLDDDSINLDLEHAELTSIKTPGWMFEIDSSGRLASEDTVADMIHCDRYDEILRLAKAHEDWDMLAMWLYSEIKTKLGR